jgi:hypothetical protein
LLVYGNSQPGISNHHVRNFAGHEQASLFAAPGVMMG